jgi:hypothetical protein
MYQKHDLLCLYVHDTESDITHAIIEGLSISRREACYTSDWHNVQTIASPSLQPKALKDIQNALENTKHLAGHPLHLPLIMLDCYIQENVDESNAIHREFGYLEESISITNWYTTDRRPQDPESLHRSWKKVPQTQNRLPFHERRWNFIGNYVEFMLEQNQEGPRPSNLDQAVVKQVNDILQNYKRLAADHKSEIQCLYKRSESMVNLVSTASHAFDWLTPMQLAAFLAQKHNETAQKQNETAQANTADMRSIGILTFFFLPATFVAVRLTKVRLLNLSMLTSPDPLQHSLPRSWARARAEDADS